MRKIDTATASGRSREGLGKVVGRPHNEGTDLIARRGLPLSRLFAASARLASVGTPRGWCVLRRQDMAGGALALAPNANREPFGQFARLPLTFGSFLARIVDAGSPGLADEAHPSTLADVSRGPYSLHWREHGGRRAQLSAIS